MATDEIQITLKVTESLRPEDFYAVTNAHFYPKEDGGRFVFGQEDPLSGELREAIVLDTTAQFLELFRQNTQAFFDELLAEGRASKPREFVVEAPPSCEWGRASIFFISRSRDEVELWALHVRPADVHFFRHGGGARKPVKPTPVCGFLMSMDMAQLLLEEVYNEAD